MAISKLGDIAKITYGFKTIIDGLWLVLIVGSDGIFGSASVSKYNSKTFALPRKGTMKIIWYNQLIWNVDTAFIVGGVDENIVIKKWIHYIS